jgi:hypothetical protein
VAVLLRVGPVPVAVFEVDPEVLDRLPAELLDDALEDLRRGSRRQPERRAESGGVRRVLLERPQGERAQPRGRVGLEDLRASVDGVDRLAPRGVPRIADGEGLVSLPQLVEDR